ncbi:MAG TPA: flagellar export chaperone FliS [Bryobacteraceae bacterium]|jgi:flagellar protein FliS
MNWKNVYLETRILSASPLELINILYEHAILEVEEARRHLAARDIAARARSITKTIAIIGELQRSLDPSRGGEIAANLGRLYQYMLVRLTEGNVRQADEPLVEVGRLLESLSEAWRAISGGTESWEDTPAMHIPVGEASTSSMSGWSV